MAESQQKKWYWIDKFFGMSQRQDMDQIPDGASPLAVNVIFDKPGTVAKRPGTDMLGSTQTGNGIYGLISYIDSSGGDVLRRVADRDIDDYDGAAWGENDADQFTASTPIQSVNYKNRVYHISEADWLVYESGGTATEVKPDYTDWVTAHAYIVGDLVDNGSGQYICTVAHTSGASTEPGVGASWATKWSALENRIKGRCIAVAQNTLFVATGNKVYYSLFNLTSNVPGDQFWNDDEGYLAASTRYFTVDGEVTALWNFSAIGGVLVVFTREMCYLFDMRVENNSVGLQELFHIGCAGPRAVTEINGWLIWMTPDGELKRFGGAGRPDTLSWDLQDDEIGESIISKISKSTIESVAAGSFKNKFYFSVGDITYRGRSIPNAVIVGLVSQGSDFVMWSVFSFPWQISIFAITTLSSAKVLVAGSADSDDVYQLNTGSNDDSPSGATAIDAYFQTKFVTPYKKYNTAKFESVLVKYRPQSADNTYLRVSYAQDSEYTYTGITDPDNGSPLVKHGIIDMYDAGYATIFDAVKVIEWPENATASRTVSLECGNAKLSEKFEISGIGLLLSIHKLDISPTRT